MHGNDFRRIALGMEGSVEAAIGEEPLHVGQAIIDRLCVEVKIREDQRAPLGDLHRNEAERLATEVTLEV